jgi:hypothetical protein
MLKNNKDMGDMEMFLVDGGMVLRKININSRNFYRVQANTAIFA